MTDTREAILSRIRNSIGPASGDAQREREAIQRTYLRTGSLDPDSRLRLFVERLRDYDANVVETGTASLSSAIAAILRANGQRKVISADGLPPELLPPDFRFLPERDADRADLNDCDGILTRCAVAIAATGSIVLTHGPGEGARRLTLLPDRHLCIVRAEQVVETVPEAFDRLAPFSTMPITFISGPSATADIEMTRIRGVHGPRFLDVALVR